MADLRIVASSEFSGDAAQFLISEGGVLFRPALHAVGNAAVTSWLIIDESGQPLGGFNTAVLKLRGISTLSQPPLHPHCALFVIEPQSQPATRIARRKKVLETLAAFLHQRSERIVSLPLPVTWTDIQPIIWAGFSTSIKYTYRKSLSSAHDEGYTSELRGHIRKALSEVIVLNASASRDELESVLLETADAQGFQAPADALSSLLDGCQQGWCHLETVHADTRLAGFAFTVYDGSEAYYLLGALSRSNKKRGVQPVLLDRSMAAMREKGKQVYDFEGSMIPGVERFFRSFGGELVPYYAVGRAPWYMRMVLRKKGVAGF